MKIQCAKYKCDECGKEVENKDCESKPNGWLEISITKWFGSSYGRGLINKEVCCSDCALKLLKKIDKIPEPEPVRIF